jgi:hypothetical protein
MHHTPQFSDPTPPGFNRAIDSAIGVQQFANATEPTAVHTMRLPLSQYEKIKDAVWCSRTSINKFTREAVLEKAERILAELTSEQRKAMEESRRRVIGAASVGS